MPDASKPTDRPQTREAMLRQLIVEASRDAYFALQDELAKLKPSDLSAESWRNVRSALMRELAG